jgi:hypothetical protein
LMHEPGKRRARLKRGASSCSCHVCYSPLPRSCCWPVAKDRKVLLAEAGRRDRPDRKVQRVRLELPVPSDLQVQRDQRVRKGRSGPRAPPGILGLLVQLAPPVPRVRRVRLAQWAQWVRPEWMENAVQWGPRDQPVRLACKASGVLLDQPVQLVQ